MEYRYNDRRFNNTKKRRSEREKLNKKKNTIEFEKQTSDMSIVESRVSNIEDALGQTGPHLVEFSVRTTLRL